MEGGLNGTDARSGENMTKIPITDMPQHFISIKDIDDRPNTPYCMSFLFDLSILVRSIKEAGLINLPLLIRNEDKTLDVVLGFRRIKALKSLGWERIPCKILQESEMSPLECLLLSLNDNLATRAFNEVEKAMVISRLSNWLEKKEVLENYMPLLGLSSQESTRVFYCKVEDQLNEDIKTSIIRGQLSLHAVRLILEMDDEAKTSVFKLMSELRFNVNQQKQLIDYISDIKHIDNRSVSDILETKAIQKICNDPQMNKPQKVSALLRELRSRIFPKLIDAEQTFKRMVSALDLPERVKISAPPFFESSHYRMEILFQNGEELKEKIERLERTKGLAELYDPWEKDFNA